MAGLTLRQNNKPLPSINGIAGAMYNEAHSIAEKATRYNSFTHPYNEDGVPVGPATVSDITAAFRAMLSQVEAVDYSSWISSSSQFSKMKKELKALNKLVTEDWQSIKDQPDGRITYEMMNDFLVKADSLKKRFEEYLDHKEDQFKKDPSRRNAEGKQDYEQPRIDTVINCLEKLGRLNKTIEERALEKLFKKAQDHFKKDMENEYKRRTDPEQRKQLLENIIVKKIIEEKRESAVKLRNASRTYQQHLSAAQDPLDVQRQYPPKDPLLDSLGKPDTLKGLHTAVKDMLDKTTLGTAPDALDRIADHESLTKLLKNYKKAPREHGIYNIDKLPQPGQAVKSSVKGTTAPVKANV